MNVRRAGPVAAGFVLVVSVAVAGCGISPQPDPHPINPPRGPFQAITSPSPDPVESGSVPQQLFMVRDGSLVAVTRHADHQPTAESLIQDLLAGPTEAERDNGITSALEGVAGVSAADVRGGLVTIELAAPLLETGRNDAVLAYAQLVCTLTARPDILGVTFTRDHEPVGVPRADGSLSPGPLTTADYADLIAPK